MARIGRSTFVVGSTFSPVRERAGWLSRSTLILALGACLALAAGCDGGGGGGDGGDGGSGAGNGSGASGAGNTTGTTTKTKECEAMCSGGGECESVACECKDGSIINTQSCNNGCCQDEAGACPGVCADNGGWGSGGGGAGGGTPTGADFGEDCDQNSDCASGHCFYVDPDDEEAKKCTMECSFGGGECPSPWECAEINGGEKYLCVL